MSRIIVIYGLISGLVIVLGILATILGSGGHAPHSSVWLGYLIMLVGLTAVLMGIKQYRDQSLGGVIRFSQALILGLGITVIASIAYVAIWEGYLAITHYDFADQYAAAQLAAKRAAGVTGAAYQQAVAEMEAFKRNYANPLYRWPMTFIEIFPVGVVVALISAALLRNPRFLPARRAPA